jgi:hypothetical protein
LKHTQIKKWRSTGVVKFEENVLSAGIENAGLFKTQANFTPSPLFQSVNICNFEEEEAWEFILFSNDPE